MCKVLTGACVALDAGDPTAIVSMPSCDGGGLDLELLHTSEVQVLTGPAPEAGAAPTCELSGPCKMQHRSRRTSPVAFVDGTVYCADDGSWSAFAILEQSSAARLEAEETFVGGGLCFGHTKTMYGPPLGNGASEGFVGVPPKLPECEPGCCPDVP